MLSKRIIPCLDVDKGKVVKGVKFKELKDAGNPVELASLYSNEGADELVFLDISASLENRSTMVNLSKEVAKVIDIPFTVGGGIKSVEDAREILRNGADKISINTLAVKNPNSIKELSSEFGSQAVVVAIDAKFKSGSYEVFIYGGTLPTGIDVVTWAKEVETRGAGEILLTSIDRDGTKQGYDINLTKMVLDVVNIPVIASGGAGYPYHFLEVFRIGADAALAAGIFHRGEYRIKEIKEFLMKEGVQVRL
ncbi:MAG: imidazole glycerol phosphate synthase subunit HisF [Thermoproteota archaeon]|nr:imidazole glycerol phosphate synthase subunit HisF [Candidatus Brockarchaeota archaeon]MBO3802023.1 imidazole glycerol phosphate synthase subunit HisF [Candidatus Brockarchaeota archaeon]